MSGEPDFPPNLDDGELWLPSDVLSDDEDYSAIALAERLARSTIDADDENGANKRSSMARSPSSTLCYGGGSTGSSNGSSLLSSPTENHSDAWDLLDAERLKMGEGLQKDFHGGDSNYFPIPSAWAYRDMHADGSQLTQRSWSVRTSRKNPIFPAHQYQQLKQHSASGWGWTPPQLMQANPGQKSAHSVRAADCSYPPWPPMQVGRSGMRAIFLGPKGSGRESGGTGVFLPRGVGSASDPKKKPACSTVLLPSRVVQALNLNVEDVHSQPTMREIGNSKSVSRQGRNQPDHDGSVWNKPCYRAYAKIEAASSEITLPQEWTY